MKGIFIVIEGTDGTGKGTQTKKLIEYLQSKGHDVASFDFPQYDQESSFFVRNYLNGNYGNIEQVGAKKASLFYALDRFDASFKILEAVNAGKIIVCNRYVASNMGHQGANIESDEERKEYFKWNDKLEYGILGIPKPDLNIILHIPAEIAQKLVDQKAAREHLENKKRDLLEADLGHLQRAEKVYKEFTTMFPDKFTLIECMDGDRLMSIEEIHQKIVEKVELLLK